jgi:CHAT domain-containing protein/Tfp pilus assembly protein PilF
MWYIRAVLITIAAAALSLGAMGQSTPSSSASADAIEAAQKIYNQEGPRAALPALQHLLIRFRESGDRKDEGITLGMLANCYRRLDEFPRALDFAQRGLALKEQVGDVDEQGRSYNQLGLIYWNMADYPHAEENLQHAIEIGHQMNDRVLEASALGNLGLVEDEQGEYRRSMQNHEQALDLDRAIGFKRGEGNELGNLGGVKMLLGRFSEAVPLYEEALKIDEGQDLKPGQSEDLGNLAACYSALGKTDEALAAYDRALRLAERADLPGDLADWHRGKGDALIRAGKYQGALDELQHAEAVYEKAGLKRELVDTLNDSGNLHLLLGDAGSATRDFQRALQLARSVHNQQGVVLNLLSLGEAERRQSRFREASSDLSRAVAMARQVGDLAGEQESLVQVSLVARAQGSLTAAQNDAAQALDVAREMHNPPAEAESLLTFGDIERAEHHWADAMERYDAASAIAKGSADPELGWRLGFGRGQVLEQQGRPQQAIEQYKSAISLIEAVRAELGENRYRAGYLQDRYRVYVALVDLLLKLHEPKEAFRYSERLRSQSYLDQLGAGSPSLASTQSTQERALLARIHQLRRAIDQEWQQRQPQRQERALETYSAELVRAERAYEDLLHHSNNVASTTMAIPSIAEVQRDLGPGSALLEYVVGSSQLDILVVRRDGVEAVTVPIGQPQLTSRVDLLRYFISRPGTDQWRPPAVGLRHLLVDPVERRGWLRGVRKLYISPDGILNYVPFAALPRADRPDSRFLVEDYVLAYVPVADALRSQPEDPVGPALAVAPADARLRWSEQEARDVAGFFPGDSRLLTGRRATETSFKRVAGEYDVLHLATHAYLNRYAPLLSSLKLEPDSQNDGQLEVYEILHLKLHASLVTLSACQTALGTGYFSQVPAGDEFVGLTRAFLSAGAHSVLATLWAVNDRSTLDFMERFYRDRESVGNAAALANAQRQLWAADARYRHPYFWAAFVLVGK